MKLAEGLYFYEGDGFDPRLLLPDCNTYILRDEITVLVDPGLEKFLPDLVREMRKDGISPKDVDIIMNTHFHIDHCQANEAFREASDAKFMVYDKAKIYLPKALKTKLV
ncbi:MAG: MBL fold metallo-hydrolase, partial [Candidatus Bathyarchaeota archaeon]|nr:MBL fold metallo-hydrolase [Candidatus Bathyarchaeota archaeon]